MARWWLPAFIVLAGICGPTLGYAEELFFLESRELPNDEHAVFVIGMDAITGEQREIQQLDNSTGSFSEGPDVNYSEGVFNPVTREYGAQRTVQTFVPIDGEFGFSKRETFVDYVNVDTGAVRSVSLGSSILGDNEEFRFGLVHEVVDPPRDPRIDEAFAAIEEGSLATAANTAAIASLEADFAALEARTDELESAVADNSEGVAMALAMDAPDFAGQESFGVKANWRQFKGEHAFALSAAGVIGRNVFSPRDRLTVDVGVGFGTRGNVGTRAGGQITW